jgi:hypothetical protein
VAQSDLGTYSILRTDRGSTTSATVKATEHKGDRPLVLYAYAESDNARANFKFFIEKGLNGKADFIFIFNGETDAFELLPAGLPNVKIIQRNNTCYDLGAFGEVLTTNNLWKSYKRFITMNASIRGPFFPAYSKNCWMDAFLGRLSDKVKVRLRFGCSVCPTTTLY